MPKVSVLLPVYNGEKYLPEAVDSILAQTFTDYEFLIIDDGSTDNSFKILKSYKDKRIKLIKNEKNIGLSLSLNKGINLASGEYIARMDQDDISLPNRLEEQLEYFSLHKEISILGSWFKVISGDNPFKIKKEYKWPEDSEDCAFLLYYFGDSPVAHPSVMFKKNEIKRLGGYNQKYKIANDLALWFKIIQNNQKIGNVPNCLLYLREHANNTSNNDLTLKEHNIVLSLFISPLIGKSISNSKATLFRPINWINNNKINNRIAYDILNIKMKVLTDFINKYGLNINKAMKFSVDIWVSLQNIFKLNIFGFIHFNFIAFIFCIRFIFRMKNYYKILPKFIVYIFPSTFIKLVRKVIYI